MGDIELNQVIEKMYENSLFAKSLGSYATEDFCMFMTVKEVSCFVNWRVEHLSPQRPCKPILLGVHFTREEALLKIAEAIFEEKKK